MKLKNTNPGLYIHIPYCRRKCPYCAFYSQPIEDADPSRLIRAMLKEIEMTGAEKPVQTLYIGGGSPTCLPVDGLVDFVTVLQERLGPVGEFTVECNPAQADAQLFERLRRSGVNRLSIGAQSFRADELQTLGRIHTPGQIADSVAMAKQAGFDNIGLDLIFAIPGSTPDTWRYSLECAAAMEVQHISAYSLTIEKKTPFARAVRQGTLSLIDEPTDRAMYQTARRILTDARFAQYEISNFAKDGFECRHNIRYWKNQPVVGIGPAAAGWYNGKRTSNVADIETYIEKINAGEFAYSEEHTPSLEQIAGETAVLGLRMTDGIDLFEYEKQTGFELFGVFGDAIRQHCFNGLLECTAAHCRLTEKGQSFADTVAQDFVL